MEFARKFNLYYKKIFRNQSNFTILCIRADCGGWITHTRDLKFLNVLNKAKFRWDWDIILYDEDGSLTGGAGNTLVAKDNITLGNSNCVQSSYYDNGVSCSNTQGWIRFAYDNLNPNLVMISNITNSKNQTVISPKKGKRLTYKENGGFMLALDANQVYTMILDQALYPTNISYDGAYWQLKPGQYIIMQHVMHKKPDRVTYNNRYQANTLVSTEVVMPLTSSSLSGSWHWENSTKTLSYIISNNNNVLPFLDVPISFSAYVCRWVNCIYPISPALKPPVTSRPADALFWSNLSTWNAIALNGGYLYNGTITFPKDGDSVRIPEYLYVVVDKPLPKLQYLELEGILELDNGINHYLECEVLFIDGGQLIVGWENDPILTNVTISMTGTKDQESYILPNNIDSITVKTIGVFGGKILKFKSHDS